MPIDFGTPELTELVPKIAVIGVGGAGCNAVNNMINANLQGVDFIVANTDAQSLSAANTDNRIQLGVEITRGLGAGAQPNVGEAAAEESVDLIDEMLEGYHMAFITAGMGGGTGTGAAPVIARRAREMGVLTVGVVTKPFQFEGGRRMKLADAGIAALAEHVDTLIIIPNQNLFRVSNERTTFADAFNMADDVLHSGVRGVTDLMVMPGLINLDFADVRTVMSEMGKAMMGTGEAEGEERASEAASAAIANPLLEESSLKGAKGVIINVTGGMDMTLFEVDEAVNMVRELVDPDALIVFGSAFNQELDGKIRVSVVATGIAGDRSGKGEPPQPSREKPVLEIKAEPAEDPVTEASDTVADVAHDAEIATTAKVEDSPSEAGADKLEAEAGDASNAAETQGQSSAEASTEPAQTSLIAEEQEESVEDVESAAIANLSGRPFRAERPMQPKADMTSFRPSLALRSANDGKDEEAATDADSKQAVNEPKPALKTERKEPVIRNVVEAAAPELKAAPEAEAAPKRRSLFAMMASGLKSPASEGEAVVEPSTKAATKPQTDQLEIPSFLKKQQN